MAKINIPQLKSANDDLPRTCSLTAVSDKGNQLYGMAAVMVTIKRHGGYDNFMRQTINTTSDVSAQKATQSMMQELRKEFDIVPKTQKLKKVA